MLKIENVEKIYKSNGKATKALTDISFQAEYGEFIAVVGKSGCGKSTLLNIIAGLLQPTHGNIYFDDKNITSHNKKEMDEYRKKHIGIILQNFSLLNDRDVYDNVELPLKICKIDKNLHKSLITEQLEKVDMIDKINAYPKQLSGGEQQRVAIARALVADKNIILADEPTGALDEYNANQIVNILRKIANQGKIVIMVTHNLDFVSLCDRCIKLKEGRINEVL